MHVSTTGDARVAASFSTVIGQIHSGEGHENEPFKLFYKNSRGIQKGRFFGIMKSILLERIIQEDGTSQLLFGVMICQL